MSTWTIKRTDTSLKFLKKHKNNHELFDELNKKLKRIKDDPNMVGGELSGRLYGKRSTRLSTKFRLIFSVDEDNKIVYLEALDHRGEVY